MAIQCMLGRHRVVARGVRNGEHEFGRCAHCRCDLIRAGPAWKRVPRGYKVVWRPRTGDAVADQAAGQAAVGREVNLRGVTVVAERTYGAQRFALVILNAGDERSYGGLTDRLGTSGAIAAQMQGRGPERNAPAPKARQSLADLLIPKGSKKAFDWEQSAPPPPPALSSPRAHP